MKRIQFIRHLLALPFGPYLVHKFLKGQNQSPYLLNKFYVAGFQYYKRPLKYYLKSLRLHSPDEIIGIHCDQTDVILSAAKRSRNRRR